MKNNKLLIIIAVIFLNLLVVFMIGQNMMGKDSKFDITLAQARELAEKQLYSRAITQYQEAALLEDSPELRLEMIEVYGKGIASGELTDTYNIFTEITTYTETFSKDVRLYEAACQLMLEYEEYADCADLIKRAQSFMLHSETLTQLLAKLRYQYQIYYGMYTQILPESGGMYVAERNGVYCYLNADASIELDDGYCAATGFTEGYAYVQVFGADGVTRHIIINTEGERQSYIGGIDSSSGVGRAWDASGNTLLLLSCKTGDTYAYYNANGEKVFGQYAYAGRFRNNVAAVMESEGKWKLIDGSGNPIIDKTFTDVALNEFEECAPAGVIFASDGNKYHMYDIHGNQIGSFACDGAKPFVDEYAAFCKDGQWGFVGKDGTVLIEAQYPDAKSFSNKMGAVLTESGWVCINPANEIVIQQEFEDVLYLSDAGVCFVLTEGMWSYLKMYYTE